MKTKQLPPHDTDFRIYSVISFSFSLLFCFLYYYDWLAMVITESLKEEHNYVKMRTQKKEVERYKTHMQLECLFVLFTIEKNTGENYQRKN